MIKVYLAYELCTALTNSKLLIASPLRAGVKSLVKSLKLAKGPPSSIDGMLFTMLSRATLAQEKLLVCNNEAWIYRRFLGHSLDLQTKLLEDIPVLACPQGFPRSI